MFLFSPEKTMQSSLHLYSFNLKRWPADCAASSSTTAWMVLGLPRGTISEITVSSTYFQVFTPETSISLIITANNQGPNLVPWGTPACTCPHFENLKKRYWSYDPHLMENLAVKGCFFINFYLKYQLPEASILLLIFTFHQRLSKFLTENSFFYRHF